MTAQGVGPSDTDAEDSANVDIKRMDIFTSDAVSPMTSSSLDQVWEYTETIHNLLTGSGINVSFNIGSFYVLKYIAGATTVWSLLGTCIANTIYSEVVSPSSAATAWMMADNWIYDFGPWKITQYWWDAATGSYIYGFHPVGVWTQWDVSAVEVYHKDTAVPAPDGAAVLLRQFHNHRTGGAFDDADMLMTPWEFNLNANRYGLSCPDLLPTAPSVP